ncbi:SPOR domain-containing protein [uncultured Thalassospira sp.]|uniref:SPOR domain-containing protein n=1 Tax=uncultured Thalassospira sp. TaxID=404382 RepID=UPI00258363E0|nr:SPOR domain-containing protein [uncultured Thalassospira sp.]
MKIRAATRKKNAPLKKGWFAAAALLPLLGACSTDDFSGLWFGTSSSDVSAMQPSSVDGPATDNSQTGNDLNRAACGLFFGKTTPAEVSHIAATEISLTRTPQENLMQAIAYDINGNYENARKLYVWLTASPPENKINLDCGQGIKLTGNVNALAQRRLVALDEIAPQFARSSEIESVVAAATVVPGPDLPDPPKVERDRRFYETGGVVTAEPEDSTKPIERMDMPVSENTAQLTRVECRVSQPQTTSTPSAAMTSPGTVDAPATAASQPTIIPVIPAQPAPAKEQTPAAASKAAKAPVTEAPTIAGTATDVDHQGAVVATNSRPVEQGELEIIDREPSSTMIELPMASQSTPAPAPAPRSTPSVAEKTAPAPAPSSAPTVSSATRSGPYYAVQLAAYRSRGRAEDAWPKFQNSSRGMLTNADHEVVSIAIEGKGLFFRLLTGTYARQSEAAQACNQLKSAGVDCLIRRVER